MRSSRSCAIASNGESRLRIARAFAPLLSAALVLLPSGAAASPQSFAALADQFVRESERRDPLTADSLGIHTYDERLDDYSARGAAIRVAWLGRWRGLIAAAMRDPSLAPGDRADAQALLDTIDLELFEDATVKPMQTDPTAYTGIIGEAVYALTGRHYAPVDQRFAYVAKRLALIPGVVAAAQANLTRPARVATLQAIDENEGNLGLYAGLTSGAKGASPRTQAAIARGLPAALASLRRFSTYLKQTLLPRSDRDPRVGARVYDRELVLAEGTGEPRAELVADAQTDFDRNRAEMLRLAIPLDRTFFPSRTADEAKPNAEDVVVRRVLDRLAEDHPTRTTIFATANRDLAESEAFLTAHPVVTLPRPATLRVVPTPDFMAGFSGASLDPAGPFDPLAGSYYYIDKIPKSWTRARVDSYLRDFNNYEMRLLSMHEAIPGHYVQFRYNDTVPSIVRRAFPSGSFAEGWAVYGEGMMLDAGYGNGDPRLRLFQLKWRLREEADTLIDAEFHTGHLDEAGCNDLLERQAYQEKSEAETKWHRLLLSHDQLTAYFVGLDAIRHAQAAERARLGADFDLGRFNAALLAMGSVEPRFIGTLLPAYLPANATPADVPQVSPSALSPSALSPSATPLLSR
jgi:hypothetical protein